MDFFPIILLFVVLVFSLEKNTIGETNTNERNQQLAMRGLFACYIIFSHMYRNSDVFDNNKASTFISIVSPSLLCMFFFYSGYGAMYKYVKKGTVAFCECFATWVKKLIIPAAVAFIAATVLEYITTGSIKPLDLFSVINELGGWFLKTLIILQFVFWFNSKIVRKEKYFVLTLLVMTTVAIAAMRLMGLQSYYYIDCFAFVFGAASYMYSRQCSVLISNAVIVVISGIFTIFMGGGYTYSSSKGYPSIETGHWLDSRVH